MTSVLQAVTCIIGIILAGRTVLRPLYRRIADLDNPAIFSATTLLVVLGTSVITQLAGLSLALGAFLVRYHVKIDAWRCLHAITMNACQTKYILPQKAEPTAFLEVFLVHSKRVTS